MYEIILRANIPVLYVRKNIKKIKYVYSVNANNVYCFLLDLNLFI